MPIEDDRNIIVMKDSTIMNKKMIKRFLNLMLMLILTASVVNAKVVDKEEAARVAAEFLSGSQTKHKAMKTAVIAIL